LRARQIILQVAWGLFVILVVALSGNIAQQSFDLDGGRFIA